MKRYLILILFLAMSFNSFSQKDTSIVIIKTEIAREIIKDLIRGDIAKEELLLTRKKVDLLETKITYKDSIINTKYLQNSMLLEVIDNKDIQFKYSQTINAKLQISLKKEKVKTQIMKGVGGTALLVLGILVISN